MEVKPGYKQTEVGVIPEDWQMKTVAMFGDIVTGATPSTVNKVYWDGEFPWVTPTDITSRRDIWTTERCITDIGMKVIRPLPANTVLVTCIASIGKNAILKVAGACNQQINAVIPNSNHNDVFLYYVFENSKGYLLGNAGITATSIISKSSFVELVFPVPPTLAEQEAIADALSDADALIASLEQLIAKKRQVKQGAMQELLTGRKRLPGSTRQNGYIKTETGIFPNDWEILPLKSISTMHGRIGWQGLKQSEFTMKPEDPFLITGMNFKDGEIRWDEVYHIPYARYAMAKDIQLKIGDVLMTKDGTIGKMLYVDRIPYPGIASLNSHLLVFRPLNNKYIPKFLFYQLSSTHFLNHIELEKSGSTFFGITQEAVGKYLAFLPTIPEQQAIANILSDMDAEIAALEGKLSKARQVKQGMMQELLTGRIRLI